MGRNYSRKDDPKLSDLDFIWDSENSDWRLSPLSDIKDLINTTFGTSAKSTLVDADLVAIQDPTANTGEEDTRVTALVLSEYVNGTADNAYGLEEQYTIGDQTVTKWSNGDMEISIGITISIAMTSATGALFYGVSSTVTFEESFLAIPRIIMTSGRSTSSAVVAAKPRGVSATSFEIGAHSYQSITTDVYSDISAKGKWK